MSKYRLNFIVVFQQAYEENWDSVNWSLGDIIKENLDVDSNDLSGGLGGFEEYADDFDFISEYHHEIAKLEKELQNNKKLGRIVGKTDDKRREVGRNLDSDQHDMEEYHRSLERISVDKSEANDADSDTLVHIKVLWDFIVEKIDTIAGEFNIKAKEVSRFVMEVFDQLYSSTLGVDTVGLTLSDSFQFPGITVVWERVVEFGNECTSTVGAGLSCFMECDSVQWIFEYFIACMVILKEGVVNMAESILIFIGDLPGNMPSFISGDRVSSEAGFLEISHMTSYVGNFLDYSMDIVGSIIQAVKGITDVVPDLEYFDQGLAMFLELLDDVTRFFSEFICSIPLRFDLPCVRDILHSFCHDAVTAILRLVQFVLNFIESVFNSELVTILKEEITEPMFAECLAVYYHYIYPGFQYFTDLVGGFSHGLSSLVSKYLWIVNRASDKMVTVVSGLIHKVSDFFYRCGTKECLLSAAKSFLQDPNFYCTLFWLIVYLILVLSFTYWSYISNKVTVLFCLFLLKVIFKCMANLLYLVFQTCIKSHKAKPKLVDIGVHCSFDGNNVRIKESDYTELIEASEKKVEQMRRIRELENELEELKLQNMVGFCEMYHKQAELNNHH